MKNTKPTLLLLVVLLIQLPCLAQSTYYQKDTTTYFGHKIQVTSSQKMSRNMQAITENDSSISLSPYNTTFVNLKNGRRFESFAIDSMGNPRSYFFERLFEGSQNLYALYLQKGQSRYFLMDNKDSLLLEIPSDKEKYRTFLRDHLTSCPELERNLKYLSLRKYPLIKLFASNDDCSKRYVSRFRFGLGVGSMFSSRISPEGNSSFSNATLPFNSDFHISAFMEFPLGKSNLSLLFEPSWSRYRNASNFENTNGIYDLILDESRLGTSLKLRYSFYSAAAIVPFVEIGPHFNIQLAEKNQLHSYLYGNNINEFFTTVSETELSSSYDLGGNAALGMIIKYNSRISYFLKLGAHRATPLSRPKEALSLQEFYVQIGLVL
ncbi:MAG: hypothetical protein AAF696_07845 [Bacteroidota bacterium]